MHLVYLQMMENLYLSQRDSWRKFKFSIRFSIITFLYSCIQQLYLLTYHSCKLDQELRILTSES